MSEFYEKVRKEFGKTCTFMVVVADAITLTTPFDVFENPQAYKELEGYVESKLASLGSRGRPATIQEIIHELKKYKPQNDQESTRGINEIMRRLSILENILNN